MPVNLLKYSYLCTYFPSQHLYFPIIIKNTIQFTLSIVIFLHQFQYSLRRLLEFFTTKHHQILNTSPNINQKMYVTKQIKNKQLKKKNQRHQRSILREMMSTCDKLGNSFLTKQQFKKFQEKQKQQRQKNKQQRQKSKKVSVLQNSRVQRSTHQSFQYNRQNLNQDFVYVKESKQIKQIKDLRQKMLPKVNKTNIERKLKQLVYIKNMGYKSKNVKLQSFKSLTRQQDDYNIINRSWEQFYQDKLNYTRTNLSQQPSYLQSPTASSTKMLNLSSNVQSSTASFVPDLSNEAQRFIQTPVNNLNSNIFTKTPQNQQLGELNGPIEQKNTGQLNQNLLNQNSFDINKIIDEKDNQPIQKGQCKQNQKYQEQAKNKYFYVKPKMHTINQFLLGSQFHQTSPLCSNSNFYTSLNSCQTSVNQSLFQQKNPNTLSLQPKSQPRVARISNRNRTIFKQTLKRISKSFRDQKQISFVQYNQPNNNKQNILINKPQQITKNLDRIQKQDISSIIINENRKKQQNKAKSQFKQTLVRKSPIINSIKGLQNRNKTSTIKKSQNKADKPVKKQQLIISPNKKYTNNQGGDSVRSQRMKKQITQKLVLTKQKLQKQNGLKLYSFIKGGYILDRNDVQGEYLSLKSFKQARMNFSMLNKCFNKVKQYRYIVNQPDKVFKDQSFKSLVYLSQIQNKLPPSLFKKLQTLNKVVN